MRWTEEIIAQMWANRMDGLSSSANARMLNIKFGTSVSRNAVIAKCNRLGWSSSGQKKISLGACSGIVHSLPKEEKTEKGFDRYTIFDLKKHTCRFPVGELYCGRPVQEGKVYCPDHCLIAYQQKEQNHI